MNGVSTACPAESRDVCVPKDLLPVATEVLSLCASRRLLDSYNT